MAEDAPLQNKLVLLGGSGVGKSNLVLRFVKDQFFEHSESTIGAAFITQTITQDDGSVVKFEIWDTAGQERYRSLAPMYYRGAHSAIVVYDITNTDSLERAKQYITEVRQNGSQECHVVLVGNKIDLSDNARKVERDEAEEYASSVGIEHRETSAKTGEGVKELFERLAHRKIQRGDDRSGTGAYQVEQQQQDEKGCPCG